MPDTTLPEDALPTSHRQWAGVWAMSVAVFAVTATEMVPVGLLPAISSEFGVTTGLAGLTVTAFGLAAGLTAPAVTSWTKTVDRRVLVLSILGIFVLGNTATVLVDSYWQLIGVRVLMGFAHGLMWSIAATVAVRSVSPQFAERATAIVLSGIAAALVLGLPIGTAMGERWGWSAPFVGSAVLSAGAACAVFASVSALPPQMASRSGSALSTFHRWSGLRAVLGVTALVVVGHYAAYTYVAPLLLQHNAIPLPLLGALLLAFGIAGVLGNFVGGAAAARESPLGVVQLVFLVLLAITLAVSALPTAGVWATVVLVVLWGLSYSALPVVLQTAVFRVASGAKEQATSLYVMVFNLSIAVGAAAGGLAIERFGVTGPVVLGAILCAAAASVVLLNLRSNSVALQCERAWRRPRRCVRNPPW